MHENEKISPQDALQDLYRGLGCTLYAMAKTDGHLQSEEIETLRLLLMSEPNELITLEAFDIQDQYQVSIEDAYAYAFRRFAAHHTVLNEALKKQFIRCMEQLAEAYDGVSKKENEILRRFRRDINQL